MAFTDDVTALTTSTNLVDSAELIQENWSRSGSVPICSIKFLNSPNLRRA